MRMVIWCGCLAALAVGRIATAAPLESLKLLEAQAQGKQALPNDQRNTAVAEVIDAIFSRHKDAALEKELNDARTTFQPNPTTGIGKVLTAWQFHTDLALPPDQIHPDPSTEKFPGPVPTDAPRTTKTLHIDSRGGGWKSTGLYAPPGEALTITLPEAAAKEGWSLRVGCHTDKIWKLERWSRFPEISRKFPLTTATTHIATPFGGLIYLVPPVTATKEQLPVTIAGAVESPAFIEGETDPVDWRNHLRNLPAPWAELQSDRLILSVPSTEIRTLDDPAALMAFWDKVLDADADLAGIDKARPHPQRITADIEISAGYMHSGYPVMTHLDAAKRMVNLQTLSTKGDWGLFHELGHNHQQPDWTFPGTVEVTCNLFTVYVMDNVCTAAETRKGLSEPEMLATMKKYIADGSNFDKWKSDPFLALCMYIQMKDAFGWEPYRRVFAQYRTLTKDQRPKTEEEKHDQWMQRISHATGKNLAPFFVAWGITTSDSARRAIADLPLWMPPGFTK